MLDAISPRDPKALTAMKNCAISTVPSSPRTQTAGGTKNNNRKRY